MVRYRRAGAGEASLGLAGVGQEAVPEAACREVLATGSYHAGVFACPCSCSCCSCCPRLIVLDVLFADFCCTAVSHNVRVSVPPKHHAHARFLPWDEQAIAHFVRNNLPDGPSFADIDAKLNSFQVRSLYTSHIIVDRLVFSWLDASLKPFVHAHMVM